VAAARLGYPTAFLGQVGTDANAQLLRASLAAAGVDLGHLREVPGASGTALIFLQPGGENSIIIVGGANTDAWALGPATSELLASAGAVLLQREIPEEVNLAVARIAAAAGVPVLLDAGGQDAALDPALVAALALLSPNETELARLTGMPTDTIERVEAAARALQASGAGDVLAKLGSDGSFLVPRGAGSATVRQHIVRAPKVVDTTGATGDAMFRVRRRPPAAAAAPSSSPSHL